MKTNIINELIAQQQRNPFLAHNVDTLAKALGCDMMELISTLKAMHIARTILLGAWTGTANSRPTFAFHMLGEWKWNVLLP